jgi:RNA polymerase sigma-70 factor (ECF subfamily)
VSESQTPALARCYLEQWRAGDLTARDRLLEAAGVRLRALTQQMFPAPQHLHWEDTGGVLHDAAMRLWRALEQVPLTTTRAFWGLSALHLRRELIDLCRGYGGESASGADHCRQAGQASTDTPAPASEPEGSTLDPAKLRAWAAFHETVERLPPNQREVFGLLWYHELTKEEAAVELGLAAGQVKTLWQKARRQLHDLLGGGLPF